MFFSIICASNNSKILNQVLLPSLKKQTFQDFEIIVIDAKEHGFKSASETLNYGASLAKGEYLIFVHHDVELLNNDFLSRLKQICLTTEFGVAGVAGVFYGGNDNTFVVSSVVHGEKRIHAGKEIHDITEVKSIDECLFVIKKSQFKGFTYLGKTWHLYGPDYSLKCMKNKEKILVLPLPIYHVSSGASMSPDYYDTLFCLKRKNPSVKIIYTTMGNWKVKPFFRFYCFYRKIRLKLKIMIFN